MAVEGEAPVAVEPTPSLMDAPPAVEGEKPAEVTTPEGEKPATSEGEKPAEVTTPEGEKPAEGEDEGEKPAEGEEDAPVEYTDFTLPEGMELDTELVDEIKALGVEKKLSQEETQRIVDMGVKLQQKNAEALSNAVVETRAAWREQAISDPEFGGNSLAANMPIAVGAREQFGTPELKTLRGESGLGYHREAIRFFYRGGKATGEHDFVKPGTSVAPGQSFYDHPTSKAK